MTAILFPINVECQVPDGRGVVTFVEDNIRLVHNLKTGVEHECTIDQLLDWDDQAYREIDKVKQVTNEDPILFDGIEKWYGKDKCFTAILDLTQTYYNNVLLPMMNLYGEAGEWNDLSAYQKLNFLFVTTKIPVVMWHDAFKTGSVSKLSITALLNIKESL